MSIYNSEQYIFELAQSFMRSCIVFTCSDLKIFDVLSENENGLTAEDLSRILKFRYVENESRCLKDVLDALCSMNLIEFSSDNKVYRISKFNRKFFEENSKNLVEVYRNFYLPMAHLNEARLDESLQSIVEKLILRRIEQLIDLSAFKHIVFDRVVSCAESIVFSRPDAVSKEILQQTLQILPSGNKGILILLVPNDHDEIQLAFRLFFNMTSMQNEQTHHEDVYSEQFLEKIGFRKVKRFQSPDGFTVLTAQK